MSQKNQLLNLLRDGFPHSTIEIMEKVYGNQHLGLARVGARIYDLKKDLKNTGYSIKGSRDHKNPSIYWYQLTEAQQTSKFDFQATKIPQSSFCCPSIESGFKTHNKECLVFQDLERKTKILTNQQELKLILN